MPKKKEAPAVGTTGAPISNVQGNCTDAVSVIRLNKRLTGVLEQGATAPYRASAAIVGSFLRRLMPRKSGCVPLM